jgi:hypothetical protein
MARMNSKSIIAITSILAACTFYWALIRAIGSGWVAIGGVTDLPRALGRVLFALVIDPLTWIAVMLVCLIVFAHRPDLRKRVVNGLTLVGRLIKDYKHYKLRIAFSIACGIVCLLLVILWVRTHRWHSTLQGVVGSERLQFTSESGQVAVLMYPNVQSRNFPKRSWTLITWPANDYEMGSSNWTFHTLQPNGVVLVVPHWFLTAICVVLAAVPWIKWRFSLHTLFIAITLVAIVLGLIVAWV